MRKIEKKSMSVRLPLEVINELKKINCQVDFVENALKKKINNEGMDDINAEKENVYDKAVL